MSTLPGWTWRISGATVRGAIHARDGRPNQDAIAWHVPADSRRPRILAIADGHGAPLHFRSHRGSRLAVRSAVNVLRTFSQRVDGQGLAAIRQRAADLPEELVHAWTVAVDEDMVRRPLSERELESARLRVSPAALERLLADQAIAYGSTLLAAVFAQEYSLFVQLGDGNIVEVDAGGRPQAPPLPADPHLYANQTTSLCSPEAWSHVRVCLQAVTQDSPRFVMLSTDGYANSFADYAGFSLAASDLCALSGELGLLELTRALPDWLHATSAQGSGDDISVGLALRTTE